MTHDFEVDLLRFLKDRIVFIGTEINDQVAIEDLTTGKTENVTEVLTAVEKADLAFRQLMQIRNKLIDAYEEINRLRV